MEEAVYAPEFFGVTSWLNAPAQSLGHLKGRVLGVYFFTHGCANCKIALPYIQKLYEQYKDKGFALIGVHSPEFASEKDSQEIKKYIFKGHYKFPIAVDNDLAMWNRYKNQYWPTLYLIDKIGRIRKRHIGEGGYAAIEQDILHLIEEQI